jgi:hypothetical protein
VAPWLPAVPPRETVRVGRRPAEEISLDGVEPQLTNGGQVGRPLDPLADDYRPEVEGERQKCADRVPAGLAVPSVLAYRAIAVWLPAPVAIAAVPALRATTARWRREDAAAALTA